MKKMKKYRSLRYKKGEREEMLKSYKFPLCLGIGDGDRHCNSCIYHYRHLKELKLI